MGEANVDGFPSRHHNKAFLSFFHLCIALNAIYRLRPDLISKRFRDRIPEDNNQTVASKVIKRKINNRPWNYLIKWKNCSLVHTIYDCEISEAEKIPTARNIEINLHLPIYGPYLDSIWCVILFCSHFVITRRIDFHWEMIPLWANESLLHHRLSMGLKQLCLIVINSNHHLIAVSGAERIAQYAEQPVV